MREEPIKINYRIRNFYKIPEIETLNKNEFQSIFDEGLFMYQNTIIQYFRFKNDVEVMFELKNMNTDELPKYIEESFSNSNKLEVLIIEEI